MVLGLRVNRDFLVRLSLLLGLVVPLVRSLHHVLGYLLILDFRVARPDQELPGYLEGPSHQPGHRYLQVPVARVVLHCRHVPEIRVRLLRQWVQLVQPVRVVQLVRQILSDHVGLPLPTPRLGRSHPMVPEDRVLLVIPFLLVNLVALEDQLILSRPAFPRVRFVLEVRVLR